MNDRTLYLSSLFAFLGGALAGAGVALLVAPHAGKVTRTMMRRQLEDTADSARHLKDGIVRRGEELREEAAHRVTDAASALAGRGPRNTHGRDDEAASV
jgi:gas vesicle protein